MDAFSYKIEPKTIQPGESVTLTLTFANREPLQIQSELFENQKDLKILDKKEATLNDSMTLSIRFTSYEKGTHKVPPLEIVQGANTFSTEATTFKVAATATESTQTFHDIFGPISAGFPYIPMFLCLLALVAVYFVSGLVKWPKRKRQPIPLGFEKFDLKTYMNEELKRLWDLYYKDPTNIDIAFQLHYLIRGFGEVYLKSPYRARTHSEISEQNFFRQVLEILKDIDRAKFSKENKINEEEIRNFLQKSERWVATWFPS